MIGLIKLLEVNNIHLENKKYKIHFATETKESHPLDVYFAGEFKQWQESQNWKNFPCEFVVTLIDLRNDKWLFVGIYKIRGVSKGTVQKYLYDTELIAGQDDLIGRIVVSFKKDFRACYVWGAKYEQYLTVSEIRPQQMTIEDFPGYNSVLLPHSKLKTIVSQQLISWKTALSNVCGVYLITDTSCGKHYVGSATGDIGLWQRWSDYVNNGHGGNKELKDLLKKKGPDYSEHFQYSVLEIADSHATDEYILNRESFWKNVLRTREFGYNSN